MFLGRFRARRRFVLAEPRFQKVLQRAASAQDARLYGAYAALEDFGDFLVGQTFQIAKDYRAAKYFRNFLKGLVHGLLNFVGAQLLEMLRAQILDFNRAAPFFGFRVDGNVFLQVALEPALVVQGFAKGDAVEPGFQGASLAKTSDSAKRFQENFLRSLRGVRGVSEHTQDQVVRRAVVVGDQPVKGGFGTGLQLGHQLRFIAAPREGAGPGGHGTPFRLVPSRSSRSLQGLARQLRGVARAIAAEFCT